MLISHLKQNAGKLLSNFRVGSKVLVLDLALVLNALKAKH